MKRNSAPKGKINITGFFVLGLMLILIVGAILTGFFFKGEEKLRVAMRNGQNVSFLVCGYNEEKVIKGGLVLIFNAKTNRIATIAVLPKTFLSYSRMENFTLEEALNKKVSFDNIRASVSKIIGYDINYYFFIQEANLIRLIDIMGGIEIYSNEIKDPQKNTYIPAGITLLDGDKSMEFLTYKSGDSIDEEYDQFKRLNDYVRNFVKLKSDFAELFNDDVASGLLYKVAATNMSQDDFMIFFTEIRTRYQAGYTDFSRGMNNLILYCDKKAMPGYDYILQAKNSGDWIKKELGDALENIKSEKADAAENNIVVEILNGTDIAGFAVRTKRYLSTFGFDILEIGNAQNEAEYTVVIMRTQEQKATKLAELINCKRVIQGEAYPDKKIDVTLILGRDFNGKMVK